MLHGGGTGLYSAPLPSVNFWVLSHILRLQRQNELPCVSISAFLQVYLQKQDCHVSKGKGTCVCVVLLGVGEFPSKSSVLMCTTAQMQRAWGPHSLANRACGPVLIFICLIEQKRCFAVAMIAFLNDECVGMLFSRLDDFMCVNCVFIFSPFPFKFLVLCLSIFKSSLFNRDNSPLSTANAVDVFS